MFSARVIELTGGLVVAAPVTKAFELFSPLGEKGWVPSWNPELVFPDDGAWQRGQVFRTRDGAREAVWIVASLDAAAHAVEYHRVEAGYHVARVSVRCTVTSSLETRVEVTYRYVGLTAAGNDEIASMTSEAHAARMARWRGWIATALGQDAASAG
jgi:hypothetical protein